MVLPSPVTVKVFLIVSMHPAEETAMSVTVYVPVGKCTSPGFCKDEFDGFPPGNCQFQPATVLGLDAGEILLLSVKDIFPQVPVKLKFGMIVVRSGTYDIQKLQPAG